MWWESEHISVYDLPAVIVVVQFFLLIHVVAREVILQNTRLQRNVIIRNSLYRKTCPLRTLCWPDACLLWIYGQVRKYSHLTLCILHLCWADTCFIQTIFNEIVSVLKKQVLLYSWSALQQKASIRTCLENVLVLLLKMCHNWTYQDDDNKSYQKENQNHRIYDGQPVDLENNTSCSTANMISVFKIRPVRRTLTG